MAGMRATGRVTRLSERSGNKNGKDWSMTQATIVNLEAATVCEVTIGRDLMGKLVDGQDVDLIVEVSTGGGYLRCDAVAFYPVKVLAALK